MHQAAPRIVSIHGAGSRWDHADGSGQQPRRRSASHTTQTTASAASDQLCFVGSTSWQAAPSSTDVSVFASSLRPYLARPQDALSRTLPSIAVRVARKTNRSLGCRAGCSDRGRCDQLLGRCVCRHGFRGERCEDLVPQLCNDPRPSCHQNNNCHEWTRFVSRCSAQCDLTANRCVCGPRSRYPDRHMFMCEWRGIHKLTNWRSPGWAGFTVVEPYHFWSSPNTTPPWFEQAVGRARLETMWSRAERAAGLLPRERELAWCSRSPLTLPAHAPHSPSPFRLLLQRSSFPSHPSPLPFILRPSLNQV